MKTHDVSLYSFTILTYYNCGSVPRRFNRLNGEVVAKFDAEFVTEAAREGGIIMVLDAK